MSVSARDILNQLGALGVAIERDGGRLGRIDIQRIQIMALAR